jgi:YegS/Rv2252/BmrU family lipid kinase
MASPRFSKAMVIYNPRSGQGPKLPLLFRHFLGLRPTARELEKPENELVLSQILERLEKYGITAAAACTTAPGDATRLARECAESGYELVVAVGGDGTINEVVNGLAGSETALGVIPAGTVNVFSLLMKLPSDLDGACRVLAEREIRRVDLGKINHRYFLSMAGVGFDAFVIHRVDSRLKKAWGAIAYAVVAAVQYFIYPFRQITLQADHQTITKRGYFLIVGNGKYYGGDMVLSPLADLSDGLLDVCLLKRKRLWNVLGYLWALRRGNLNRYMDAEVFQCRILSILGRIRHPIHADAEYMGRTPALIQVVPGALKVVA